MGFGTKFSVHLHTSGIDFNGIVVTQKIVTLHITENSYILHITENCDKNKCNIDTNELMPVSYPSNYIQIFLIVCGSLNRNKRFIIDSIWMSLLIAGVWLHMHFVLL